MIKYFFCAVFFIPGIVQLRAQTVIYPDEFRCISMNGPIMNYWKNATVVNHFTRDLDSLLTLKQGYRLPSNTLVAFTGFKNSTANEKSSNNQYPQIRLDLIEYTFDGYIKAFDLDIKDTAFTQEVISVLRLELAVWEAAGKPALNKGLDIFIKKGASNAMGVPVQNLALTASGFLDALKKSMGILLDTATHFEQIEMKVSGACIGDNFILEKTEGLPRTTVVSKNKVSRFNYQGSQQIIRWGEQEYRDIILKGKNKTALNPLMEAAIYTAIDKINTGFVWLIQEGRDVVADKNYQLLLPAQIGSEVNSFEARPFIELLPGNFHTLASGKDTIALFSIQRGVTDTSKKLFLHQVSNGVSRASVMNITDNEKVLSVNYDFLVEGRIKGTPFQIKISNGSYIREFYLKNELILIAAGDKGPERFVTFDNSIPAELLNALLIIGYNSFFL